MRDVVTPAVRAEVFQRDGRCVLSIKEPDHVCRNQWGDEHASDDLDRLTLEHVKDKLRMGKRAPSDALHLVALCGYRNSIRPLTKLERWWVREYLMTFVPREAA